MMGCFFDIAARLSRPLHSGPSAGLSLGVQLGWHPTRSLWAIAKLKPLVEHLEIDWLPAAAAFERAPWGDGLSTRLAVVF